ncbi:hypothetical protein BGZ83_011889, partial [Gryganskiella cystojenkinii]
MPPKRNRHPYKDLCIAVGAYCGDQLYGCDFRATDLYGCDSVGSVPYLKAANAEQCTGVLPDPSSL